MVWQKCSGIRRSYLGDLIDRGPQSEACLPLLENPWFRSVRGNHEQMACPAHR
ncbi:metallophosphoesterase [Sodalis sp. (in: enterobacteria)]|uniref:metallophosphoesterase n=1 Tax=Sodalis sp. (in: enterobacteria) TaxID=1898979 RepID=UPI003F37E19E